MPARWTSGQQGQLPASPAQTGRILTVLSCIFIELFVNKPIFQGTDEISQFEAIYSIMGTPSEETWRGLHDLPWYELVKPKEPIASRFRSSYAK